MTPLDQSNRPRPRTRAARAAARGALAAGLLVSLAGCGGDDVTAGPAASPVAATTSATPAASASGATSAAPSTPAEATGPSATTAPATAAPADEDAGSAAGDDVAPPLDAGTEPSEQEADGAGLSVVDVRTAPHDGFDRVVLELAGDGGGAPGWFAHYVDDPAQQGSGTPLEVAGESHLEVVVRGLGYPFDTGQEELVGRTPGDGAQVVQEVLVGGVFEGQAQVVIGLDAQRPYSITRLADPPRVVVDVLA